MNENSIFDNIYNQIKLQYTNANSINANDIETILQELHIYQTELLAQNDELKAQQELLQNANEEHELLFQNASTPYILIDGKHSIKKFNLSANHYFNFIQQNKYDFKIDMYLDKGQITSFYHWIDSKQYKYDPITLKFRCGDKSIKTFKVRGDIYPNTKYWIMLTLENVTTEHQYIEEIKKLEDEKYKQQQIILTQSKIAAVGEMLGNIAHQWRQPLSVISLKASALKFTSQLEENISPKELEEYADTIIKHTDYLSITIDDFRNFFTQDISKLEKFNIKDALTTLYKLVIDSLNDNYITCEKNITDIYIHNNMNQIIQAMLNICNNAKDAMVDNIEDTEKRYFFVSLKQAENNAIITFRDSGGGIDSSIIDKIFEPYFTTKHPSIGTGIGLYMTNQIITKHFNGTIEVTNINYKHQGHSLSGAEFKITLPLDQKKPHKN